MTATVESVTVAVVWKSGRFGATIKLPGARIRASSVDSEVDAARRCAAEHFRVAAEQVRMRRMASGNIPMGRPWVFDCQAEVGA